MNYLLDTHILIWWTENSPKLDKKIKALISDPTNKIYVSMASAWEIGIKTSISKLHLKTPLSKLMGYKDLETIPLKLDHITTLIKLPHHHKDPFDRMLVAQAKSEKLTLLTTDPKIKLYF